MNANQVPVKAGDLAIHASQVARLNALREKCLDEQTFRLTWLGSYKTHAGVKCSLVTDLTFDQGSNLLKRLTAHSLRQDDRMQRAETEGAANLAAVVGPKPAPARTENLDDVIQTAFESDDEEERWIHGLFGKSHRRELDITESTTALSLLIAMKMGEDHYDQTLTKARALGRVR